MMTDSPGALEAFYFTQTLLGLDEGPASFADRCEEVTDSDIQAVSRGIELDTVYFLYGSEMEQTESERAAFASEGKQADAQVQASEAPTGDASTAEMSMSSGVGASEIDVPTGEMPTSSASALDAPNIEAGEEEKP